MAPQDPIRITTLCVGHLCVGYRSAVTHSDIEPKYTAVVSVFLCAFFVVWAALVVLLIVADLVRRLFISYVPNGRGLLIPDTTDEAAASAYADTVGLGIREAVVKEIVKRQRLVQEVSPMKVWSHEMGEELCAVCLEAVTEGTFCRNLPCSHCFHVDCIDQWILQCCDGRFENVSKCPICKAAIQEEKKVGEHLHRRPLGQGTTCPVISPINNGVQLSHQPAIHLADDGTSAMTTGSSNIGSGPVDNCTNNSQSSRSGVSLTMTSTPPSNLELRLEVFNSSSVENL